MAENEGRKKFELDSDLDKGSTNYIPTKKFESNIPMEKNDTWNWEKKNEGEVKVKIPGTVFNPNFDFGTGEVKKTSEESQDVEGSGHSTTIPSTNDSSTENYFNPNFPSDGSSSGDNFVFGSNSSSISENTKSVDDYFKQDGYQAESTSDTNISEDAAPGALFSQTDFSDIFSSKPVISSESTSSSGQLDSTSSDTSQTNTTQQEKAIDDFKMDFDNIFGTNVSETETTPVDSTTTEPETTEEEPKKAGDIFKMDDGFSYQVRDFDDKTSIEPPKVNFDDEAGEFMTEELSPAPGMSIDEHCFPKHKNKEEESEESVKEKEVVIKVDENIEDEHEHVEDSEDDENDGIDEEPEDLDLSKPFLMDPSTVPSRTIKAKVKKKKKKKKKSQLRPKFPDLKDEEEEEDVYDDDKIFKKPSGSPSKRVSFDLEVPKKKKKNKKRKERFTLSKMIVKGDFQKVEENLKDKPLSKFSDTDLEEALFLLTRRKEVGLIRLMLTEKITIPTSLALNTAFYEPYFDQDVCLTLLEFCGRELFEKCPHLEEKVKQNERAYDLFLRRFG